MDEAPLVDLNKIQLQQEMEEEVEAQEQAPHPKNHATPDEAQQEKQ